MATACELLASLCMHPNAGSSLGVHWVPGDGALLSAIERVQSGHVFRAQLEVVDVGIGRHALGLRGFRKRNKAGAQSLSSSHSSSAR